MVVKSVWQSRVGGGLEFIGYRGSGCLGWWTSRWESRGGKGLVMVEPRGGEGLGWQRSGVVGPRGSGGLGVVAVLKGVVVV